MTEPQTILTNARLILPGAVVLGTALLRGAEIAALGDGPSGAPGAVDLDGDYLLPGLVDLHTDNLERQVQPRTNARWPSRSAMIAHDAQVAAAGVTTVLDSLCLGDLGFDPERTQTFREGVADLDALAGTGLLRADHFLHLRCEMPAPDVLPLLDTVAGHRRVRLVSLMDHSPGVGQYSVEKYRSLRAREGMSPAEIDRQIARLAAARERYLAPNRRALLARIAGMGVPLASHDDRTEAEIAQNFEDGIRISEFPVTLAAASAARARGMEVIAGAPNIVRGGSHSGNVAAAALFHAGTVTALASDYVPHSLIEAVFRLADGDEAALPACAALVTSRPARMVGLLDRGTLAPGYRADLIRVRVHQGLPVVRAAWRAGVRVA